MLNLLTVGPADAPAIVFLHGGGLIGRSWLPVAEGLPDYQCVLLDLPGHGQSRADPFRGLAAAAAAVAETVDSTQRAPVHVVGLSLGGFVALHLMGMRPDLVGTSLVSGLHAGNMRYKPLLRLAIRATYPAMRIKYLRDASARAIGVSDTDLMSDAEGRPHAAPRTVRDVGLAALNFRLADLPRPPETQTLVLAGEHEISAVVAALPMFRAALPNCQTGVLPGGGHGWCLNTPDLAADVIRAWVTGLPLPAGVAAEPGRA